MCRRRSDNENRRVAQGGVVARVAAFVHGFLTDCVVELDNELQGGICSSALEEVALGVVRGALSLLPHIRRVVDPLVDRRERRPFLRQETFLC